VTADLIYVNFGMPEDYTELERRGLDVKGKIVIARYGAGWRGLKPKLAQEHGAVGCIIYSDPHEDGYWAGDVYPKGGYRPEDGVQRGSVADITQYSGDPLTPGSAPRRTRSASRSGGEDDPQDSGDPDLLRRREGRSSRRSRARSPRRAGAGRFRSPTTSGPGRRRCTSRSPRTGARSRSTT
jgi:hypothetical protein